MTPRVRRRVFRGIRCRSLMLALTLPLFVGASESLAIDSMTGREDSEALAAGFDQ